MKKQSLLVILVILSCGISSIAAELAKNTKGYFLKDQFLVAQFNKDKNYILCEIATAQQAESGEKSLLSAAEPMFQVASQKDNLYWSHMSGICTVYGQNNPEKMFSVTGTKVEGNSLVVNASDYFMDIKQTCTLIPGQNSSALRIDYHIKALRDCQNATFSAIPGLRFTSETYERFYTSYRVNNGKIKPYIKTVIDQPRIDNVMILPYMNTWYGVRNPENGAGVLIFFPGDRSGYSFCSGKSSSLLIECPYVKDCFIPAGEETTETFYIVPFQGDYQDILTSWCAKLDIDLDELPRQNISPTGKVLGNSKNFTMWWDIPTRNILKQEAAPEVEAKNILLSAAKGEYEPFQLVLSGKKDMGYVRMEGLQLKASNLINDKNPEQVITKEHFSVREVDYIKFLVSRNDLWTGEFPDALREKSWFDCTPEENTVLWITLKVPENVSAGNYSGEIRLTSSFGKKVLETIPLKLKVFNFNIPEKRHLSTWIMPTVSKVLKVYPQDKSKEIYEKYLQNIMEHRGGLLQVTPRVAFKPDSDEIDFIKLDSFEKQLINSFEKLKMDKVYSRCFEIGVGHQLLPKTPYGSKNEILTPLWCKRYSKAAKLIGDFLREHNWQDKVIFGLYDEPPSDDIQRIADCVKILKKSFPEIKTTYWALYYDPRLYGLINVWTAGLSKYSHITLTERKNAGDEIWVANSSYYTIGQPAVNPRLLWWQLWLDRIDGFYYWNTTTWLDWMPRNGPSDGNRSSSWLYPGPDGPIDTIRWELTREGLEDFEYLWLLANEITLIKEQNSQLAREARQVQDEVSRLLKRNGRHLIRNPNAAVLHEVREKIGNEIEKLQDHRKDK